MDTIATQTEGSQAFDENDRALDYDTRLAKTVNKIKDKLKSPKKNAPIAESDKTSNESVNQQDSQTNLEEDDGAAEEKRQFLILRGKICFDAVLFIEYLRKKVDSITFTL